MTVKQRAAEGRRRMKCVMKVWTREMKLSEAAMAFNTYPDVVERWCKTAMSGAKQELAKYVQS